MKVVSKEEWLRASNAFWEPKEEMERIENDGIEITKAIVHDDYSANAIIGIVKEKDRVRCELCGEYIEVGKKVFVGIEWDSDGYDVYIGEDCLDMIWASLGEVSKG